MEVLLKYVTRPINGMINDIRYAFFMHYVDFALNLRI